MSVSNIGYLGKAGNNILVQRSCGGTKNQMNLTCVSLRGSFSTVVLAHPRDDEKTFKGETDFYLKHS